MTALIPHLDPVQGPPEDTRSNVKRAGVPLVSSEDGCWNRKDLACLAWVRTHKGMPSLQTPLWAQTEITLCGFVRRVGGADEEMGRKTSKDRIVGNFPRNSSLVSQLHMDLISSSRAGNLP